MLCPPEAWHEKRDAHGTLFNGTRGSSLMPDAHAVFAKRVEAAKKRIRSLSIPAKNRRAILAFCDSCFSQGLSSPRVLKYLSHLSTIAPSFTKEFTRVTRADVEKVVRRIEGSGYSEWTKHDYKITLKKFFRWLRGTEDEYPPEVKWIRSTIRNGRLKLPDEILTPQEVQAIITAAPSVRDKAFISCLYESGCRITEMLFLCIGQLQRHPHGFQITVDGTMKGPRRLLLIASAPYLTDWLNQHPRLTDPKAPLWITSDRTAKQMGYSRACSVIQQAAQRAGVRKAVNPHNFRHSRATHLAKHLTEAQMKEYFGWVQSSDMASTYVHLSGRDIDTALLRLNNIEVPEGSGNEDRFTVQPCPVCKLENPPANKFCSRCGTVLDETVARTMVQRNLERSRADQIMDRLLEDAEFRSFLDKKLRQLAAEKMQKASSPQPQ